MSTDDDHKSFDPRFFARLKEVERDHFWFQVRRKWIYDRLARFAAPPATFLEAGCGTGNVSSFLARQGYAVTGCDCYNEGLDLAWPGFLKVQGDAAALPFPDCSFDAAGLFDVIEHLPDDGTALREAWRVLHPGGVVLVSVPAREELWSWTDDQALHKRRYTPQSLTAALRSAGFEVLLLEYMFAGLYLPMRLTRKKTAPPQADMFKVNAVVNRVMKGYFELERLVSGILPLPIGTSLIAVGRKG